MTKNEENARYEPPNVEVVYAAAEYGYEDSNPHGTTTPDIPVVPLNY